MRTGVLKGVCPLQGVTGALRRREGAWPPSESAASARLRISHPLRHNGKSRSASNGATIAPTRRKSGGGDESCIRVASRLKDNRRAGYRDSLLKASSAATL